MISNLWLGQQLGSAFLLPSKAEFICMRRLLMATFYDCRSVFSSLTLQRRFDDFQPYAASSASQSQQERPGERSQDIEGHFGEAARTSS
jgi:hypothetical protein